ncbi:MAG: NUMOD3 domain-containing DNA-binding protein [Cetobacterium sp.]
MMVIYCIKNKVNGNCYIGATKNFKNRKRIHEWGLKTLNHPNTKLNNAVIEYDFENFVFEILETLETNDRLKILERESYYIKKLDTCDNGYNMSYGFDGTKFQMPSIETLEKKSELMKGNKFWIGKKHTQETKDKIGAVHKNKVVSEETKRKLSISKKGKMSGEKNPFYGKKHTEETKQKVREKRGFKVVCNETGEIFDSLKQCAEKMNLDRKNLGRVCKGISKHTKGYTFKFYDKPINYQS